MTSVGFIINGDPESAMGYRARSLAKLLGDGYAVEFAYRTGNKIAALFRFSRFLIRTRPQVTYVFDMSYSGVLAAWFHRLCFRNRLIIETGDAIYELMRSTGNRGRLGLRLTRCLEDFSLRVADRVVVRGSFHKEWLSSHGIEADVIQDGVDMTRFTSKDTSDLRKQFGLEGVLTVGLVGSSIWSEKLQMCYGWELVETLCLLKDKPVKGIMIGGGSGITQLQDRCREYGIEDNIVFLGHVPFEQLPSYLRLIDICLSTQTNDIVGQVRTTGKLPLYLAAGRYILASKVGEAAIVLDEAMLVEYEGVKDEGYPRKLKQRIEAILDHPEMLERSAKNVGVAKEYFDYSVLAERMKQVIEGTIKAAKSSNGS